MSRPARHWIATVFLAAQVTAVAYARVADTRYFCWAPFDAQNEYSIAVRVNGRALSDSDIEQRYRIRAADLDSRSIAHVTGIIRYAEEHYYRDGAAVTVRYRVNGQVKPDWHWPSSNDASR